MTEVTTPLGEVRRDPDGGRALIFNRSYDYPIDHVWSALTDSDRLARWYGSYEGEAGVGGTVYLTMTAEEDAGGEPATVHIVECEPPHRLTVDIVENERTWRIGLTLLEDSGTTSLIFEQSIPPEMETSDVGTGWHWYLDRLTAAVSGNPMPKWDDYHPFLASAYQ